MWFAIAGILGITVGLFLPYDLSPENLPYVAMAILAALDSIFGALLAYFNKRFNLNVFMTGLVSNAILAVLLTFIGDLLGISLYFAVLIVFGVRIFNNMASIRRLTLDVYFEHRARDKERIKRLALKAAEDEDNADEQEKERSEEAEVVSGEEVTEEPKTQVVKIKMKKNKTTSDNSKDVV